MFVEVFKPFQTRLIIGPSIASRFNNPIVRKAALSIPTKEMVGSLNYQKQKDTPIFAIDTDNRCSLLSIARRNRFASATTIGACNDHTRSNNTYHKTNLVEIIEIAVENTIFRPHFYTNRNQSPINSGSSHKAF
jgi:hypothetical protein